MGTSFRRNDFEELYKGHSWDTLGTSEFLTRAAERVSAGGRQIFGRRPKPEKAHKTSLAPREGLRPGGGGG